MNNNSHDHGEIRGRSPFLTFNTKVCIVGFDLFILKPNYYVLINEELRVQQAMKLQTKLTVIAG